MDEKPLDVWKQLRATGGGDGVLEVPSIDSGISTGFGNVRFAVGPGSEPRLLVPVAEAERGAGLGSTPKMVLGVSRFRNGARSVSYLDLMSVDRSLDPVFGELVEEILGRIQRGESPVRAVTGSIGDFRELLLEGGRPEVPDSQILGLIGELYVLRLLTEQEPGAVEAWTGPFEQRHDFRRGLNALEVKTSSRSDASTVSVHGTDQLECPLAGALGLVLVRLDRASDGGLSVAGLCEDILGSGGNAALLERGLRAIGCSHPDEEPWNRISFALHGLDAYEVRDGFPRLVTSHLPGGGLPPGVSALTYSIDLQHAEDFRMTPERWQEHLKGIAG
jgi:hypothetical protein